MFPDQPTINYEDQNQAKSLRPHFKYTLIKTTPAYFNFHAQTKVDIQIETANSEVKLSSHQTNTNTTKTM